MTIKNVICKHCEGHGSISYIEDHTEEEQSHKCLVCNGEGEVSLLILKCAEQDDAEKNPPT